MLSERTIEAVRDVAIADLIGKYIDLKKAGSAYKGCCPFHNENTPSFNVTPARNMYKCFGCGVGGDGIKFVMEFEKVEFIEAIRKIATAFNITIEETQEAEPEKKELRDQMLSVNRAALNHYNKALTSLPVEHWAVIELNKTRKLTEDTITRFELGYVPDEWKFITQKVIAGNVYAPAKESGLVREKEGNAYDLFRDRIIFPIHDHRGNIVAFGGRKNPADENKENPKYLNSSDSLVYHKDATLYGLWFANKSMRTWGKAYLVEGYFDVISMHQAGLENTVAPCGTGFTIGQAKLLKKYTNHIVIAFDGDKAGVKAAGRAVDILLQEGFKVEVVSFHEDEDADSVTRRDMTYTVTEYIQSVTMDGVMWKAGKLMLDRKDEFDNGPIDEICQMFALVEHELIRENYINVFCKKHKQKAPIITKLVKQIIENSDDVVIDMSAGDAVLPPGVDREDFLRHGFYEIVEKGKAGYYFQTGPKSFPAVSNFVVKPLFHVISPDDNNRLIEIDNGTDKQIMQMPSKSMISVDGFSSEIFNKGYFIFYGNKTHLTKILLKIGDKLPPCYELTTLGWQKEGFFAYSNCVYDGALRSYDHNGVVVHNKINYFSPAISPLSKMERQDHDKYENDRYLSHKVTQVTFEQWSGQMEKVYGTNGMTGVAFACVTLFRDLVFKLDNTCPNLYAYGQKGSGKSAYGMSISNFFFAGMNGFNLNQGTDFAFWNRLERFRNCPVVFNEFDENTIKEEWFRGLKSIYDGEGRERGKMGGGKKTETQKVNSTVVLLGQYLSTKDDGSVLSRCVIAEIRQNNERSTELKVAYDLLKKWEAEGLSGLIADIIQFRDHVVKELPNTYGSLKAELVVEIRKTGGNYTDRILNNYCTFLAVVKTLHDKLTFGFSYDSFKTYCTHEIVRLSNLIAESSKMADFWNMIAFLIERGEIYEGWNFHIQVVNEVLLNVGAKETEMKKFSSPTKLLFLRLNTVHSLYLEAHKRQNTGSGINMATLKIYFDSDPAYFGNNPNKDFRNKEGQVTRTSSFVFDYDKLGVHLETFSAKPLPAERKVEEKETPSTPIIKPTPEPPPF